VSAESALYSSGFIRVNRATSIFVGGSVIAGIDNSSDDLLNSGTIRASLSIGTLTIRGSVLGNATHRALISAGGEMDTGFAFGKISIGGRVEFAGLRGGYGAFGTGFDGDGATTADSRIGRVTVGGDWIASSLAAGIHDNDGDGDLGDRGHAKDV